VLLVRNCNRSTFRFSLLYRHISGIPVDNSPGHYLSFFCCSGFGQLAELLISASPEISNQQRGDPTSLQPPRSGAICRVGSIRHIWTHPVCKACDRSKTKSLHPYIRPVGGRLLRSLALMNICAHSPHHPYGLVSLWRKQVFNEPV